MNSHNKSKWLREDGIAGYEGRYGKENMIQNFSKKKSQGGKISGGNERDFRVGTIVEEKSKEILNYMGKSKYQSKKVGVC